MSSHPTRSTAPLGIKAVSLLAMVDAALMAYVGYGWLGDGFSELAILAFGFAALQALVGVGIWMLEPYAWGAAMYFLTLVTLFEAVFGLYKGAALTGGIALYLYLKRDLFEK